MTFSGMDVDRVDEIAALLDVQVKAIAGVVGVVNGAVSALGDVWHGDDVAAFHALWHSVRRPQVESAHGQMSAWITTLRAQVAQQRETSASSGHRTDVAVGPETSRVALPASASGSVHDKQWVLVMAQLARAAYGKPGAVPSGFSLVKTVDRQDGLGESIYGYTKADGTPGYVIAFRGSDSIVKHASSDWLHNNLTDRLGVGASQYKEAVDDAQQFLREHPGADVTFTGHSLGGGLAEVASVATGHHAVAFNAAEPGYSDLYYAIHGTYPSRVAFLENQELGLHWLALDTSAITSFRTPDDPLTGVEGALDGRPSGLGTSHTLDYTHPQINPLAAHGIDDVIASIADDGSVWWR